jgi:hypothetical protein
MYRKTPFLSLATNQIVSPAANIQCQTKHRNRTHFFIALWAELLLLASKARPAAGKRCRGPLPVIQ